MSTVQGKTATTKDKAETPAGTPKKERNRSPAYPAFDLRAAIEKLGLFHQRNGFTPAYAHLAIKDMDHKPTSSSGLRALAALLAYGLLQDTGSGKERKVTVSPRGKVILIAPPDREEHRRKAIQEAALAPKLYKFLWSKYGPNLPNSSNLEYDLSLAGQYNPDVIKGLIKDFVATMEFAKPDQSAILEPEPEGGENGGSPDRAPGNLPPAPRDQEAKPMPETQGATLDLPIPLIGGGMAVLRVPRTLSEDNYKLIESTLAATLKAFKAALVPPSEASQG